MTTDSNRIDRAHATHLAQAWTKGTIREQCYNETLMAWYLLDALDALAAVEKERDELHARLASVERVVEAAKELFKDGKPINDGFQLKMTDPVFKDRLRRLYASLPPSGEGEVGRPNMIHLSSEYGISNAGVSCDALIGPCACGAWHEGEHVLKELSASTAREAGMREALEFYAEPTTYLQIDVLGLCGFSDDKDERGDYGKRARAALSTPQPATPQTRGEGEGVELDPMVLRWSPERAKARRLVKAMNDTPPDSGAGAEVERLRAVVEKLPSEILGVVCRVPHHENYYGSYTRGFEKAREEIAAMVKSAADSAATQGRWGMVKHEPPPIAQQIAELEAAGWKQGRVRTLWRSPSGSLHLGPHGAWKTMKAATHATQSESGGAG